MKRNWSILLVIALLLGGILITGCPTEPEKGREIDGDMIITGGKYRYSFDTPRIVHGTEYELIFTVEDCDDAFVGKRLGGKICYKMDLNSDDEKLLSGWTWATPPLVGNSDQTRQYKFTFKAGAKNEDSLTPEVVATTPDGGKQYFSLEVQTEDYESVNQNFNVLGSFTITEKETFADWVSGGTVTLGNVDGIVGKGVLSAADMEKIRTFAQQYPQSKIAITIDVVVDTASNQPTWGIGSIGGSWNSSEGLPISIPGEAPLGPFQFVKEFDLADVLSLVGNNDIIINIWGCSATKAELFRPGR